MTIAARPLPETGARPGVALVRRAVRAPLWAHVFGLVLLLGATAPLLKLDASFTTDEGAYAHQAHSVEGGGWPVRQVSDVVDPSGRWFGMVNGSQGPNGNFTYTAHPLVVVVMARLASGLGDDVGLHLLPLAGVVGSAIAAWLLAGIVRPNDRRLSAAAFWVAATSPVLVNGTVIWAHTASAALAGFALVGAVRIFERGVNAKSLALLGVTAAGGVLLRSEGLLFAGALTAALMVGLWFRRARTSAVVASAVVAGPAMVAYFIERRWVARIVGGPSLVQPAIRQVGGSWISGRLSGGWHDLINPNAADLVAAVLGAIALSIVIFAGVKLRRLRVGEGREVAGLLTVALGLLLVRTFLRPIETVTGLLAAWPLALVGLLAAARWNRLPAAERFLAGVGLLFGAAVFATGYAEGGGQEWGGRFYFPLLVPMAVLAVVWLVRAAEGWTAADRRALLAPLVAMAVVPSLLGLVVVRDLRVHSDHIVSDIAAVKPQVIVTNSIALPRAAWRLRGVAWLRVDIPDMPDVVDQLRAAGIGPVAVVGPTPARSAEATTTLGRTVPAPHLERAGYSLRVLDP